jgi:hypothetical protein
MLIYGRSRMIMIWGRPTIAFEMRLVIVKTKTAARL